MKFVTVLLLIIGANSSFAEDFRATQGCEAQLGGHAVSAVVGLALKDSKIDAARLGVWLQSGGQGDPWQGTSLDSVALRYKRAFESARERVNWNVAFPQIRNQVQDQIRAIALQENQASEKREKTAELKPVAELQVNAEKVFSPLWFKNENGWTLAVGAARTHSEKVTSTSPMFSGIVKDVDTPGSLQALRLNENESVLTEYNSETKIEVTRVTGGTASNSIPFRTATFHVPMALGQTTDGRVLAARINDNSRTGARMIVSDITNPRKVIETNVPVGSNEVRGVKFVNSPDGQTYLFSPERVYRYNPAAEGYVDMELIEAPDFENVDFKVTDIKVQSLPDGSFIVARQGKNNIVVDHLWIDGTSDRLLTDFSEPGPMSMHRDLKGRVFVAHAGLEAIRIFEPLVKAQPIMRVERERPMRRDRAYDRKGWFKVKWSDLPNGNAVFAAADEEEEEVRIYTPNVYHPILRLPYALSEAPGWNRTDEGNLYLALPGQNGKLAIYDLWFPLAD